MYDQDAALTSQLPDPLSQAIREFLHGDVHVAIVLGSGLGNFAETLRILRRVSTSDLPSYPHAGVVGHDGELVLATHAGKRVLLFSGRVHGYEGYTASQTALTSRIAMLGSARLLLLTNAAGGVHASFEIGDLMLITDYIVSPLAYRMGLSLHSAAQDSHNRLRPLFPHRVLESVRAAATSSGILLREGTYGFCSGPNYETRSEIALFRLLGADAVGMSTVPEIISARLGNLDVAGISCITNKATAIPTVVTHEHVTDVAARVSERFASLLHAILARS